MNAETESERVERELATRRWHCDVARTVADGLIYWLRPFCFSETFPAPSGYCMAAGSLRRGKALVGDVEILYVPKIGPIQKPGEMFPSEGSLADMMIEELVRDGKIAPRPNVAGVCAWGPLNKLATHKATGMPVDLFATTVENWFVSLVIRTGPAELNIKLCEGARRRGLKLHAYGAFEHPETHEQIYPKSEREVFELCGLRYLEPEDRN